MNICDELLKFTVYLVRVGEHFCFFLALSPHRFIVEHLLLLHCSALHNVNRHLLIIDVFTKIIQNKAIVMQGLNFILETSVKI